MSGMTRRSLVMGGGMALGALVAGRGSWSVWVQAESGAADGMEATVRVRTVPAPELRDNVYPIVMTEYVPLLRAVPGYAGYFYAFDNNDPAITISLTLLANADARPASDAAFAEFRGKLDDRLKAAATLDRDGTLAIGNIGDPADPPLPAALHGCAMVVRDWAVNDGVDLLAEGEKVRTGLVPALRAQEGFIGFYWLPTATGPTVVSIHQTVEQMQASSDYAKAWVAENAPDVTKGAPTIFEGTIQWADGILIPRG